MQRHAASRCAQRSSGRRNPVTRSSIRRLVAEKVHPDDGAGPDQNQQRGAADEIGNDHEHAAADEKRRVADPPAVHEGSNPDEAEDAPEHERRGAWQMQHYTVSVPFVVSNETWEHPLGAQTRPDRRDRAARPSRATWRDAGVWPSR